MPSRNAAWLLLTEQLRLEAVLGDDELLLLKPRDDDDDSVLDELLNPTELEDDAVDDDESVEDDSVLEDESVLDDSVDDDESVLLDDNVLDDDSVLDEDGVLDEDSVLDELLKPRDDELLLISAPDTKLIGSDDIGWWLSIRAARPM